MTPMPRSADVPAESGDPSTPEEIKAAIIARRKAIRIMMAEIRFLTNQLSEKIGTVGLLQFMSTMVETGDFDEPV